VPSSFDTILAWGNYRDAVLLFQPLLMKWITSLWQENFLLCSQYGWPGWSQKTTMPTLTPTTLCSALQ